MHVRFMDAIGKNACLLLFIFTVASALCGFTGCGGSSASYEDLDMVPTLEAYDEVTIGYFSIPIPLKEAKNAIDWTHNNPICFSFELHGIVKPSECSRVEELLERYEKSFRSEIIGIVRGTSMHDLSEVNLSTLKLRMMAVARKWLGQNRIRRLVISESRLLPL